LRSKADAEAEVTSWSEGQKVFAYGRDRQRLRPATILVVDQAQRMVKVNFGQGTAGIAFRDLRPVTPENELRLKRDSVA
jgi:hypothetical protein